MEMAELQRSLRRTHKQHDAKRGRDATFPWLTEEVGELARAPRHGEHDSPVLEFSDVPASLANLSVRGSRTLLESL